jgi:hypothetical protein
MFGLILVFDLERAPLPLHLVLVTGLALVPFAVARSALRVIPRWV